MALAFGGTLGTNQDTENSLTTITLSTTAAVPSGGFIVVGGSWYLTGGTGTLSGGSLTWTTQVTATGGVDANHRLGQFWAQAPSGLASGTTLTLTISGAAFGRSIFAAYFTGVATSSPVDQFNSATGTASSSSTVWTPGSITTTNPDDLLVAVGWNDGHISTSASGTNMLEAIDFNNSTGGNNAGWTMVYRIVAATGTYNTGGTFTDGAGDEWTANQVAYKADTGGGAAPSVNTPTFQAIPFIGGSN